jgi:hypothetical protein
VVLSELGQSPKELRTIRAIEVSDVLRAPA